MSDRDALIAAFLDAAGWGGAERSVLAADASFRRYDRIRRDGETAVLMDAPPGKEDVRPFLRIARHLTGLGYSAPEIFADDAEAGLVLLEDMGDDTYTRLLQRGEDERVLYELAVDLLADLHGRDPNETIPSDVPPYDDERLQAEADLLVEWYMPEVRGARAVEDGMAEFRECWRGLLPIAQLVPSRLVLRDYHVDNLMKLPGREGLRACGLLDFQDALIGPVTYDVMSLIEDARRDIDPALAAHLRARYLDRRSDLDPSEFDASFAVLAAQRHCKVIGIFTRLARRDLKPLYLRHIPRVWRLLERTAEHRELVPLKTWLDRHIPKDLRVTPPAKTP